MPVLNFELFESAKAALECLEMLVHGSDFGKIDPEETIRRLRKALIAEMTAHKAPRLNN